MYPLHQSSHSIYISLIIPSRTLPPLDPSLGTIWSWTCQGPGTPNPCTPRDPLRLVLIYSPFPQTCNLAASKDWAQQMHLHPRARPPKAEPPNSSQGSNCGAWTLKRQVNPRQCTQELSVFFSLWLGRLLLIIQVALRRTGKTEKPKLSYDWFNFFFSRKKKRIKLQDSFNIFTMLKLKLSSRLCV